MDNPLNLNKNISDKSNKSPTFSSKGIQVENTKKRINSIDYTNKVNENLKYIL